jgi:hypothetical protein
MPDRIGHIADVGQDLGLGGIGDVPHLPLGETGHVSELPNDGTVVAPHRGCGAGGRDDLGRCRLSDVDDRDDPVGAGTCPARRGRIGLDVDVGAFAARNNEVRVRAALGDDELDLLRVCPIGDIDEPYPLLAVGPIDVAASVGGGVTGRGVARHDRDVPPQADVVARTGTRQMADRFRVSCVADVDHPQTGRIGGAVDGHDGVTVHRELDVGRAGELHARKQRDVVGVIGGLAGPGRHGDRSTNKHGEDCDGARDDHRFLPFGVAREGFGDVPSLPCRGCGG